MNKLLLALIIIPGIAWASINRVENNQVDSGQLADGSVTTAKLAPASVTTSKLHLEALMDSNKDASVKILTVAETSNLIGNITVSDIILGNGDATHTYGPTTSDGSDNARVNFGGGGAFSNTRGSRIEVSGNESATTGSIRLHAGNISGGTVNMYTGSDALRMTVDESGNVGIGTASPTSTLHVVEADVAMANIGSIAAFEGATGGGGTNSISIDGPNDGVQRIYFGNPSDVAFASINADPASDTLTLGTNNAGASTVLTSDDGTVAMTIDSSQNVGIGTASPATALHVDGVITIQDGSQIESPTQNTRVGFGLEGSNILSLHDATGAVLRVVGGNVGIGTASPDSEFELERNVNGGLNMIIENTGTSLNNHAFLQVITQSAGDSDAYVQFSDSVDNWTAGADDGLNSFTIGKGATHGADPKLVIDGSGNVGIGTASPVSNLHIDGGASTSAKITIGNTTSAACMMFRDTDQAGWTEVGYLNGAIAYTTIDADGICDGA